MATAGVIGIAEQAGFNKQVGEQHVFHGRAVPDPDAYTPVGIADHTVGHGDVADIPVSLCTDFDR
ncbi:hypothetical protein D3C76_1756140 [compost metagenome]